jgi:hypothetical protein
MATRSHTDERYDFTNRIGGPFQPKDEWIRLGKGRHRITYLLPSGNVLKVPRDDGGERANIREAEAWRNRNDPEKVVCYRKGWKLARCRLVKGTKLLVMEFIKGLNEFGLDSKFEDEQFPPWCKEISVPDNQPPQGHWGWNVDAEQVGLNKKGELVAFDYAE